MKQFTSEERIRRVWDREEAKAVLCRHAYFEAANRRNDSLEQLWVQEPEHQATASYGKNWGYYVGMDAIRGYYVDRNPIGAPGTNICHPVATICIEEAEDGKTCQAMWYNASYETRMVNGVLTPLWIAEKCSADLIKEGADWKIWHMFIGVDMQCEASKDFKDQKVDLPAAENPVAVEFGTPNLPMDAYVTRYNYYDYPSIPAAYASFQDKGSSGPKGNPKYQG